jgi:hypothetical protein
MNARRGLAMVDDEVAGTASGAGAMPAAESTKREIRRRPLVAFVVTVVVVITVLGLIPATVVSMYQELQSQSKELVYDLFTGQQVDPTRTVGADTAFVNITATDLNEANLLATLTISGNRVCPAVCPPITATFYSLGNDAARRRGLPPSAAISVPGESGSYTFTIELPIRGTPQRYPFDDYNLLLGLIATIQLPNGREQIVGTRQQLQQNVSLTLEDRVARLNMIPPMPVDPAQVRSPSDPTEFLLVDQMQWQRPRYLRILTVMLVILISASGVFALGLRSLHELVLGIGGIILGIWGVRSVVVQSPLPDVTLIDVVLGFVIMILLLALTIRAARYFYVQSGLAKRG